MKQNNNLLFLLLSFVVVSACWIGFNVYHASVTSTISPEVSGDIQPIPPNFNTKVIEQLHEREEKPVDEERTLKPTEVISPIPSLPPTQAIATATPTIQQTISQTP